MRPSIAENIIFPSLNCMYNKNTNNLLMDNVTNADQFCKCNILFNKNLYTSVQYAEMMDFVYNAFSALPLILMTIFVIHLLCFALLFCHGHDY